jgi:hypothetical protein
MGGARQERSARIAMADDEIDRFLATERTCRMGTVGADGTPHVTPLWFVWDGTDIWVASVVRSRRWTDIGHHPTVSVAVDTGEEFGELRGVEIVGTAKVVGEVPRAGAPVPELEAPERLYADKYYGGGGLSHDGRHAWLRVTPTAVRSWDARKLGSV